MFKCMAEHVGVNEVRYVSGVTKMLKVCKNNISDEHYSTHAINVVNVPGINNGQPFMVDCTWSQVDNDQINNEFWQVKPFWFIHNFFPTKSVDQCLHPTWSMEQFASAPNYFPAKFRLQVNFLDSESHFANYFMFVNRGDRIPLKFMVSDGSPATTFLQRVSHGESIQDLLNEVITDNASQTVV